MNIRKKLLVVGALASSVALVPQTASAGGWGGFFVDGAFAFNTRNWSQQFHVDFDVHQTGSNSVTAINKVFAVTTRCNHCNTAAISMQIIVAPMNSNVSIDNEAYAKSDRCSNCSNLASAYAIVFEIPNPYLSWDTKNALNQIKNKLYGLQWSGLTGDELQAAIDELAGEAQSALLAAATPAPAPAARAALVAPAASVASPAALASPADVPALAPASPQVIVYRQADQ